jgi:hypothetical protein
MGLDREASFPLQNERTAFQLRSQLPSSHLNMAAQKKNLLLVLTSCDTLLNGKGKTGWYLPELAHPYNVFAPSFNLTIASPAGGPAPLDPGSAQMFKDDEGCKQVRIAC